MALLGFASALISLISYAYAHPTNHPRVPKVDLGYAVHEPTYFNTTDPMNLTYATYANVRFAHPPTGDLRWRPPKTPPPTQHGVQNGTYPLGATDCFNTFPKGFSLPGIEEGLSWGSEDCHFLDVKVPEGPHDRKLPVLHWLYGGGYFIGSKEACGGEPASLFHVANPDQKFIVVTSNYRLGATGWLSAPGEDMTPNAGLWYAVAALEWTQQYISKFGGDPNQVTIMGESAGGAIIKSMITLRGGTGSVPFQQAFMASPGARPLLNNTERMQDLHKAFLESANFIKEANRRMIVDLPTNGWVGPGIGFSIIVDGDLVPDLPDRLFAKGQYHKSVSKVLSSNMLNDGQYITTTPADDWSTFLSFFMTTPTPQSIADVSTNYPNNDFVAFAKDSIFQCHARTLARTFADRAHRYVMSVSPASHGLDRLYYFHVDNATTSAHDVTYARHMQRRLRDFFLNGDLGAPGFDGLHWPAYAPGQNVLNVSESGFAVGKEDEAVNRRCDLLESLRGDSRNGF